MCHPHCAVPERVARVKLGINFVTCVMRESLPISRADDDVMMILSVSRMDEGEHGNILYNKIL